MNNNRIKANSYTVYKNIYRTASGKYLMKCQVNGVVYTKTISRFRDALSKLNMIKTLA